MSEAKKDRGYVHHGNNLKRTREIIGVKQLALAEDCGWSQQKKCRNWKTQKKSMRKP